MMLETYQNNQRKKLIATIVAVVVVAGVVVLVSHLNSKELLANETAQDTVAVATTTDTANTTSTSNSAAGSTYKDGSYSASSNYFVPPGQESITVNLAVKDGVITSVSIANSENDRESAEFQQEFESGYKTKVVGKKIDGLQIGVVAGASDTTDGFNEALAQIAAQAKS